MQYFTVQASTPAEAMEKMRRLYGDRARVHNHRTVRLGGLLGLFGREGVEVTGYIANGSAPRGPTREASLAAANLQEEKRRLLEQASASVATRKTGREAGDAMQQVLAELKQLRETITAREHRGPGESAPPGIGRIDGLLQKNDFPEQMRSMFVERLRSELSLEQLEQPQLVENTVVEWIAESVAIAPPIRLTKTHPNVFVLVGPTGVGKTTTIAKLAAIFGLGADNDAGGTRTVRMVTIDNYRIAAKQQIETYGEIMRIPVSAVESAAELKKTIALYEDSDLILIDTIGKSPTDYQRLAEMKAIIDAAGPHAETHLAISATTKAQDIGEILQQFEPFKYRSIIITKLDETTTIGNVLGTLIEMRKSISYVSDGQVVPQDIEQASVVRLMLALQGFRIQREALEQRFGARERISEQLWR